MKSINYLFVALLLLPLFGGCGHRKPLVSTPDTDSPQSEQSSFKHQVSNGIYYWRTRIELDSAELAFIRRHEIHHLYIRMFDVKVCVPTSDNSYFSVIPNATLLFSDKWQHRVDSISDIAITPVVYLTLDALKAMHDKEDTLAELIITRALNMCSRNYMFNVEGLQLDCDWTESTEQSYFTLCNAMSKFLKEYKNQYLQTNNLLLSSTIRLHQLQREAPPVDYGILMVYNTGAFDNPDANNSIIDIEDVKPYLKNINRYALHLDIAYPTYSWQLLYRNRKFIGLFNNIEVSNATYFKPVTKNKFVATKEYLHNDRILLRGDIIRQESSGYPQLLQVKTLIDSRYTKPHATLLYHLDMHNLSNYSDDEINTLYNNTIR